VTSLADAVELSGRAILPAESGFAELDGVRVAYDVYGEGDESILLFAPWAICHSRYWKGQVAFLARHFRVITFDPRGNGRSDRPGRPDQYGARVNAAHGLELLDATGTEHCVLIAHCGSAGAGLLLAANHPERILGALFMSPALPLTPPLPERVHSFDDRLSTEEGWAKSNRHYWARDFRGYLDFFFDRCFPEPHSTKQIEDAVGWALETTPETLALTIDAPDLPREEVDDLLGRLRCPLVVTQGDEDRLIPGDRGAAFAAATGAELVSLAGVGHCPNARHPVLFNLLVRDLAERVYRRPPAATSWRRALRRGKRAVFVSSPIGLGHAWRDVAIARELRALVPGLEIDWLAQDPVTHVLEACGERIHPASHHLANESRHMTAESSGHDLPCFQAWRRMDEILLANFMLFHEVATEEHYDLWIGDEAWELDYYLHENPELKTAPYAFLTDFVGWLPLPEGGADEARLTADYNAEMIEQIARFPRIRDRAIFVGSPDDVVPHAFGPGLPGIRGWVEAHFEFSGYILAPDAGPPADRAALRAELGYAPDEEVCIVTVGGSGVGGDLLRRVVDAFPEARRLVPSLRMVAVCGPRIDPSSLPAHDGLEVVGYVHGLSRHLAVCDVAVVQGGLTTCMELTAAKRPFLYFPLRRHFEQNLHVRHRLERYGAGQALDYETSTPASIAEAIATALRVPAEPSDVEHDGAARAAALIATLL
jgi:pimeloyl-ACP methyl ester carboxylesterase/predicted glycosyltransferase